MIAPLERDWEKILFVEEFRAKLNKGSFRICKKKIDEPKAFWDHFLWNNYWKVEYFGRHGSSYIWLKAMAAYNNKNIMPTVKHGGGSV